MSSPAFEAFLARLYTDEALLAAFLRAPDETARAAGLDDAGITALCAVDRDSLAMAGRSFRAKRAAGKSPGPAAKARLLVSRLTLGLRRY
jgi:hypothetical protein